MPYCTVDRAALCSCVYSATETNYYITFACITLRLIECDADIFCVVVQNSCPITYSCLEIYVS